MYVAAGSHGLHKRGWSMHQNNGKERKEGRLYALEGFSAPSQLAKREFQTESMVSG